MYRKRIILNPVLLQFYRESKIVAEKAALQFGEENPPLTVVSVVIPIVGGASMSSTAPLSVNMMLSLITGICFRVGSFQILIISCHTIL